MFPWIQTIIARAVISINRSYGVIPIKGINPTIEDIPKEIMS